MSALVRQLGEVAPVGQMVFFRSAFAILPVVVIYAIRGELRSAVRTGGRSGSLAEVALAYAACSRTSRRSRGCRSPMRQRFHSRHRSSP
jgi:hypothetical protein